MTRFFTKCTERLAISLPATVLVGCVLLGGRSGMAVEKTIAAVSERPNAPPGGATTEPPVDAESLAPEGDAPILAKVLRYARRLVERYDRNGDGKLQPEEWRQMQGTPKLIDRDGDGEITLEELAQYVANHGVRRKIRLLSKNLAELTIGPPLLHPSTAASPGPSNGGATVPPGVDAAPPGESATSTPQTPNGQTPAVDRKFYVSPKHQPPNLPEWFTARDANGDGQLTMAEYAPKATQTDVDEFARYDADGDGVITPKECERASKATAKPGKTPAKTPPGKKPPAQPQPAAAKK
jgi:hypothetical protein